MLSLAEYKHSVPPTCIERGQIVVRRVGTEEQKADVLTKSMATVKLSVMTHLIGVRDLSVCQV